MFDAGELRWIDSGGGPLLLIDRRWLAAWRGHRPYPPEADTGTDYERACAIDDYLGIILVGIGHGLVLGDERMATAWWPLPELSSGILVRWRWAPEWRPIAAVLDELPTDIWVADELTLSLPSGHAILFDSAMDTETIEESLTLDLAPGTYRVATVEHEPDSETALLLHRLVPA